MNGYTYKVIISGTCTPAVTSNTVTLAVSATPNPVISTQPANKSVCVGSNVNFTITASGTSLSYQWQIKVGAVWNNLVDDAVYSGTPTSSMTITNVTAAMNANNYRCVITATCGAPVNSNAAILTVVAAINNVISADQTVCSGYEYTGSPHWNYGRNLSMADEYRFKHHWFCNCNRNQ